jgi:hypothetical protein
MSRFALSMLGFLFASSLLADDAFAELRAKMQGGQLVKTFDVKVQDEEGLPIENVTVSPWALRSSQGHGRWGEDDEFAEMSPIETKTNSNGVATIQYPFYRNVAERTRTFSVSVNLKHPDFTIGDAVHIDVPLRSDAPETIEMVRGASVEFIPIQESGLIETDQIYVVSSDRLTSVGDSLTRMADRVTLKPLAPGPFRAMLVRLSDGEAIEFSDPIELTLQPGANESKRVEMHPAIDIHGRLGDEVPRPIVAGRVCVIASPRKHPLPNFDWTQWAPVDADGGFVIKGFPRTEPLQVIALCDQFVAANGRDPNANVEDDRGAETDPLGGLMALVNMAKELTKPPHPPCTRPQTFEPNPEQPITIRMSPLVRCEVSVLDPDRKPLSNLLVGACPNVYWWDWGSQIYGDNLMRSTEWLTNTMVEEAWDSDSVRGYDMPCFEHSDENGLATIYLPPGKHSLFVHDRTDAYRLPIFMGRRDHDVTVVEDETLMVTLELERAGTEALGEYDKLAGVVFGCSTREGKQICALPEVRNKMNDFAKRLREADDPRDPVILSEAYLVVAEAFERAGDSAEAEKWRSKAEAQKAKIKKLPAIQER